MIKKALFLSFLIATQSLGAFHDVVTIVLMVKNEEAFMVKTLAPFVDAGIQSFVIFDTGSTDNTIAVTDQFFKDHNVQHYIIAQEPFIDFATSRNHALDFAEECFPDSPFFLMIDAEWYMHNVKGLIDFCMQNLESAIPAYLIRIVNKSISFTVPRLVRGKSGKRFIGVVHENIPLNIDARVPNDTYFELGESRQGVEKSRKRWERDVALLLKEHQKNPQDSRTLFYLAQTYQCLGDGYNAYRYFKLRSEQAGWPEENFETFYRLGYITEYLSRTDPNYTWDMAYKYFCAAHKILPYRAEPLVHIAEYYWLDNDSKNIPLCYLFAKRACELPYPETAYLFINPYFYNFKRYELLSNAALSMGDFETAEAATRKALQAEEAPHLFINLAACIAHHKHAEATGT